MVEWLPRMLAWNCAVFDPGIRQGGEAQRMRINFHCTLHYVPFSNWYVTCFEHTPPSAPSHWSPGSPGQFSFDFCVISGLSYILSTKSRNQNKRKQTMRLYLYFSESKKAIAFLVLKILCC